MTTQQPRDPAVASQPDGAADAAGAGTGRPKRQGGAFRRLAELLALTGFAIAQPVLDVTGRSPDFFLFRQPSLNDMRLLVLIVAFVPPFLLWTGERVIGLVSRTAERAVHLLVVAALFALVAVQVGKQVGAVVGIPLGVLAAVAGIALAALLARSAKFGQALRYAAPAPLVFLLVFALTTPAGVLVRPARDTGQAAAAGSNRPPIVILFFDEFPVRTLLDDKGAIDERLFPNFARLGKKSTWFPNATAVIGSTPNAAPAVLSGKYPSRVVAPSYVEHPENLFTLLARTYRVEAYEAISQLCPPSTCDDVPAGRATGLRALLRDVARVTGEIASPYPPPENMGESFAEGVESARQAGEGQRGTLPPDFMFGKNAKNSPERLVNFLAGLRPAPDPTVHFLHLLTPHVPYRRLPNGRTYAQPATDFPVTSLVNNVLVDDPVLSVLGKQRLLLQVAYVDSIVGQMIDRLEQTGLWDDALVVVTADHGAGLEPGAKRRRLNEQSGPDVAFVPLFVKEPRQREGKVDPRNEQHVDVLPTIADVLDVRVPWRMDGVSLLGTPRPSEEKLWFDEPGHEPHRFDAKRWGPLVRGGVAPDITKPERGPRGLFAVGPLGGLVGKKVADLPAGAPAPFAATLAREVGADRVRLGTNAVPAMVWGELDAQPPARWLAVSVNGTVAGAVATARGTDGKWRFLGMADDAAFRDGANDVALHLVEGDTLRPVRWR